MNDLPVRQERAYRYLAQKYYDKQIKESKTLKHWIKSKLTKARRK